MRPPEDFRKQIAACMRTAMERQGVTQVDMAARLGVTKATLNNWVQAKNDPPAAWLGKFAVELELTLAELLTLQLSRTEPSPARPLRDPLAERVVAAGDSVSAVAAVSPDVMAALREAKARVKDL